MKNLGIGLLSILINIVIISCQVNGTNGNRPFSVVDIEANINNMRVINLSKFKCKIKYVVFEKEDDLHFSALPGSRSNLFDIKENLILVSDIKKCLLYDTTGHFISAIGRQGRGPGEYPYVTNVSIGNNKIYISNLYDLMEYDTDGSYTGSYTKTFFVQNQYFIPNWISINDTLIFGHVSNSTGNNAYKALIINKKGNIKNSFNNYIQFGRERTVAGIFEYYACFNHFKNLVFYKEFYNDTLFSLDASFMLTPKYCFNLGRYKEPVSERAKAEDGDMMEHIYLWNVFQTQNYLFLTCDFGKIFPASRLTLKTNIFGSSTMLNTSLVLGIFDINLKDLEFVCPTSADNPLFTTGLYNDIDAGPRFLPHKQINDSTMVMWVDAKQLKEHVASDDYKNNNPKYPEKKEELEKLARGLTDFDNPVLMFVTFSNR